MAEIEILSKNIESLNDNLDKLNSKLEGVASSVENTSTQTTAMNTTMDLMNKTVNNLGSSVPALTSAFQLYKTAQIQVNAACQAFAANPIGATLQIIATAITVITTLLDKFKERISKSSELTDKWNQALAALEPIMKAVNEVLDVIVGSFVKFVGVIVDCIEWIGKFIDSVKSFFGLNIIDETFSQATQKAKDFAKLQADIDKEELKRIEERGASKRRQGELVEQIANAEGEAKKKLINDLKNEIKLQTQAEIALNNKRIALMEYKQELDATSKAELKELAELKAKNDELLGEQANEFAKYDRQLNSTTKKIANNTTKTAKTTVDTALKEIERYVKERNTILKRAYKEYSKDMSLINAMNELEDARLKKEIATEKEILQRKKDRLVDNEELERKSYEKRAKMLQESIEGLKNILAESNDSDKKKKEELVEFQNQLDDLETDHYIQQLRFQTESFKLEIEEREEFYKQFKDRTVQLDQVIADEYAKTVAQEEEEWQNRLDGSVEYINDSIDTILGNFDQLSSPQQKLFDVIGRTTDQIGKEIQAFHNLSDEERNTANKSKLAMGVMADAMNAATQAVNGFMSAKQSQIQADLKAGEITEEEAKKEFEKTKKVQIAMSVMGMLGGIAQAISQAMQLGPIAGPIVGAINSALVATSAGLQISKIKELTLDSVDNVDGETGLESVGSVGTTYNYGYAANPLLNEDYDNANLNRSVVTQGDSDTSDQRVYILEDDIQESNRRVEVREHSTTF